MDDEDPGMADFIPDDDEEMFALLDEHCPVPEPTRRSSFSKKRLSFSSPMRPNESCLVQLNPTNDNPDALSISISGENNLRRSNIFDTNKLDDEEPDWAVDNNPQGSSHKNTDQVKTLSQDYREYQTIPDIGLTVENRSSTVPERSAIPDIDLCEAAERTERDVEESRRSEPEISGGQRATLRRNRYAVQSVPAYYRMFDDEDGDGFGTTSRSLLALKRMPAHTNFITMTSSSGGSETRLYLTRTSSDHYRSRIQNSTRRWQRNMNRNQLLSESVEILLERIERKRIEQLVRDEEASLALAESMMVDDLRSAESSELAIKKRRLEYEEQSDSRDSSLLFVDRFAPRTFIELLSDSRINREVLQWVQAWDPAVFHRPARIRPKMSPKSLTPSTKSPFHNRSCGFSFPNKRVVQPGFSFYVQLSSAF